MPPRCMGTSRIARRPRHSLDYGFLSYLFLCAAFSAFLFNVRSADGSILTADERSDSPVMTTPCWHVEEFVVAKECAPCPEFDIHIKECVTTGFVEKVNCAKSKKEEFKSCRSAVMEKHIFWKFVGGMMGASAAFALVVIYRQRTLDGRALEKVRKQIESI